MNVEGLKGLYQKSERALMHSPEMNTLLNKGYKLSPATMAVALTSGNWVAAPHLLYASTKITSALAKGGARLIFTMPPRHGKSMFTSIYTPLWFMDAYPGKNVITATYGKDLVVDWGRIIRDTILEQPPELDIQLKKDSRGVVNFTTTDGGIYNGVGVGGATTGKGAHLFGIDDYIKNAEEALSEIVLDKIWQWFKAVAYTRLEPGASILIIATRWAQQDLIGRIMASDFGHKYTEIKLPAIAEDDDPLGRSVGEPLWPERYSLEALQDIKEVLGTFWWNAMYQQRPLGSMSGVVTGDMIKTMSIADMPPPERLEILRTWDLAATDGAGDYTAGPKIARDTYTNKIIIMDMERFQKSPFATEQRIKDCAVQDTVEVSIYMEQEPGSSGKTVVEQYKTTLHEWDVQAERPTGPIEVRCSPFLAQVEAGNVFMLPGAWNEPLRNEVDTFPGGAHDDQLAALALGYNHLSYGQSSRIIWGSTSGNYSSSTVTSSGGGKVLTGATW